MNSNKDDLRALAETQRLLEKYGQIEIQELMVRLERAELALATAQETPQKETLTKHECEVIYKFLEHEWIPYANAELHEVLRKIQRIIADVA
jgi:hypothetical protein